jgi:hypothetical protein
MCVKRKMKIELAKAVGSTRLWRVQFGVPPNCVGTDMIGETQMNNNTFTAKPFRARRPK